MTITDPQSLAGLPVLGPYGVRLGRVLQTYVNVHTAFPEWVAVSIGLPYGQIRLMPLAKADHDRDALHVPYDLAQLTSAPIARPGKELSTEDQRRLYPHYGLQARPAVPPPDAGDRDRSAQASSGDAVTRSEERLRVGVERPVIGNQVVALERVRMVSEVAGEDQMVSGDLRKEKIAYETTKPEARRPPGRGRQDPRPLHPQEDVA